MAISLKEQLRQVRNLNEVTYHAPVFDKSYYEDSGAHDSGGKAGVRLFYDFYAMENLWSWVGSGSRPKHERDRQRNNPADTTEDDPLKFQVGSFQAPPKFILPASQVKVIDDVFEQVARATAKNLINYTHLAVVQEFQYLMSQGYGWTRFRQGLVASYNKNKSVSREEFDRLVQKFIPEMKPYPDTIKRLLKYSKYYSSMTTDSGKDVYDVSRKSSGKPNNDEPSVSTPQEPDPISTTPDLGEPDDTDYNAEPVDVPPGADYDDKEPVDVPQNKKLGDDPEHYFKPKKAKLKEEKINPSKIKKVYSAMNKAGVTLDDVEKAYNYIEWGGAYGGPRWGEGALAMLKLMKSKKTENPEDLTHIIDHIYDLQHNTGSLLNKGPMFVRDEDLNRRFRVTHVARFLPFVSPLIRQILLRYLPYIHGDAELEKQKDKLLTEPTKPFTPEERQQLEAAGLKSNGHAYRVNIMFVNKQKQQVGGVYYEVAARQNGKYTVNDNFKSDVQAYDTFAEAYDYIIRFKNDFIISGSGSNVASPSPVSSEKNNYISSHTKIKLTADKELQLLDVCKMGWREKASSKYYKAYFPGSKRFHMYAFSDGSFLCTFSDTDAYKVFKDWPNCFNYCKSATDNALDYPDYDATKAKIGQSGGSDQHGLPSVSVPPPQSKEYYLDPSEMGELITLASMVNASKGDQTNGMIAIGNNFSVGKKLSSTFGKPYKIIHKIKNGQTEDWNFKTWEETINFIKHYGVPLLLPEPIPVTPPQQTTNTPSVYTAQKGQANLPPNATSKTAYKVHVGIHSPPKHSMRLTVEDEQAVTAIGFFPKMVGQDVWYIHKTASDTVKFYPNDTAKIIFTGTTKMPVVTKTIDNMLAWLPTKYSATTQQSPLTSQSVSQIGTKGSKAGAMFEKTIYDAGFVWNATEMNYSDGDNVLTIDPYPKSTIKNIKTGEVLQHSANLPSLANYLKNTYPTQKKTLTVPAEPTKAQSPQNPLIKKVIELLKKGGFKLDIPADSTSSTEGVKYSNDQKDFVNIHFDGKSEVFNAKHHVTETYQTVDELLEYLQEKYGASNADVEQLNGISNEEYNWVKNYLSEFYSYLKPHMWHWSDALPVQPNTHIVLIMKNEELTVGSNIPTYLKLSKENGLYTVEGTPISTALVGYKFTSENWPTIQEAISSALLALNSAMTDSPDEDGFTSQPLTPVEENAISKLIEKNPGWASHGNGMYIAGSSKFSSTLEGVNFSFYVNKKFSNNLKTGHSFYYLNVVTPYKLTIKTNTFQEILYETELAINKAVGEKKNKEGITTAQFQKILTDILENPKINLKKWWAKYYTNTEGENPYVTILGPTINGPNTIGFYLFFHDGKYILKDANEVEIAKWDGFSSVLVWLYNMVSGHNDGGQSPESEPTGDDNSGGGSQASPSSSPDNITEDEFSIIKDLVDNDGSFNVNLVDTPDQNGNSTDYIAITPKDVKEMTTFGVSKHDNEYVVFEIDHTDKGWNSLLKTPSWDAVYDKLYQIFAAHTAAPSSPNQITLTEDEQKWIKTFIGGKNPKLEVTITDSGAILVLDPHIKNDKNEGNPVIFISKTTEKLYMIRYYTEDFGEEYKYEMHTTFPDVVHALKSNFEKYTTLFHKNLAEWMAIVSNALNDFNYHNIGEYPENSGTSAWENQDNDSIYVFNDGSANVHPTWGNESEPSLVFAIHSPEELMTYLSLRNTSTGTNAWKFLSKTLAQLGYQKQNKSLPDWAGVSLDKVKDVYSDIDGGQVVLLKDGDGKYKPAQGHICSFQNFVDMAYAIKYNEGGTSSSKKQKTSESASDSILTYSEAKPFMDNNFYHWGAPPHSYDSVDFKYDDAPSGAGGFGRIVISNGGTPKIEIYKTNGKLGELNETWVVKQYTKNGPKQYNFLNKLTLIDWFKKFIVPLFSWGGVDSPTANITDIPAKAKYLSTELDSASHKAGFNSASQNSYGVMYEHKSGLYFQVFDGKIKWSNEKGSKEIGIANEDQDNYLMKVFQKITPQMSDDEVDNVFSIETLSRKEKTFDKILRLAKISNGVNMDGTSFHTLLTSKGFAWNDFDNCYMNEELSQVVVVTPSFGFNTYKILWVDNSNIGKSMSTNDDYVVAKAIGPDGSIAKVPTHSNATLTPSGATYKITGTDNGHATQLNDHDTKLLTQLGFKWIPAQEVYRDGNGSTVCFFTDGSCAFSSKSEPFGKTSNSIPEMLMSLIQTYGNSAVEVPASNPSGETYTKHRNAYNSKLIQLNGHDDALLNTFGFKWFPSENHYYKNPKTGDTISFYDDGSAVYHDPTDGNIPFDSIPHALKFIITKYSNKVKRDAASTVDNKDQIMATKEYIQSNGLKVVNMTKNSGAYVFIVLHPETKVKWYIGYQLSDGHVTLYHAKSPKTPIEFHNIDTSIVYINKMSYPPKPPTPKEVGDWIKSIGFNFAASMADGSMSFHNSEHDKVLYIYPDGLVKYTYKYIFNPNTGEKAWDISTFKTWQEFELFIEGVLRVPPEFKTNTAPQLKWAPNLQSEELPTVDAKDQKHPIKPDSTTMKFIIDHGYKWDDGTIQFVKINDPMTFIVCTNDGVIHWYGGAGTKEVQFKDLTSLGKYFDWGDLADPSKEPPKETPNSTPPMPKQSNFDYLAWGTGAIAGGKYVGTETIHFLPIDDAIMQKLGFKPIQLEAPSYQYQYVNEKTGEKVIAQVDGKITYITPVYSTDDIASVQSLLTTLWEKHTSKIAAAHSTDLTDSTKKSVNKLKRNLESYGFERDENNTNTLFLSEDKYLTTVNIFPDLDMVTYSKTSTETPLLGTDKWKLTISQATNKLHAMHLSGLLKKPPHFDSIETSTQPNEDKTQMPWSNFNYSVFSNKSHPHSAITLVPFDENTLSSIGFHRANSMVAPTIRYNNVNGEMLAFYADKTAKYWPNSKTAKFSEFPNIKAAMQMVWDKHHIHKTNPTKTGEVPYSDVNYKDWYKTYWPDVPDFASISLLPQDTITMEKMGFKKEKVDGEKELAFKIGYHKSNTGEVAYFFASGTASYWINGNGPKYFNTTKDLMQFLYDKYGGFIEEGITFKKLMGVMLE